MSNARATMPLQHKVSMTLMVLVAAFILVSYGILRGVIAPAFDDLELTSAEADLKRAEQAIQRDLEQLQAVTADWAPWDDMWNYATGRYPGFVKSNLDRPTLENLGLDVLVIYDAQRRMLWGQLLVDGEEQVVEQLDAFNPAHVDSLPLSTHTDPDAGTAGILATTAGPMIISSSPILMSDDSGPIAGAVVMGQRLTDERLARLRERTGVEINWSFDGGKFEIARFAVDEQAVTGSMSIRDIHGRPLMRLETRTPRRISALGSQTINAALLFLMLAGVLVTAFVWLMLRGSILAPIEALSAHVAELRKSGDLSRRLKMRRRDEIGALAGEFDGLTDALIDARKALLDQSFKAGKADTAAEVLHNIRNAMTPMINGVERLRKSARSADRLHVTEATEQLADPEVTPERREKLLAYIDASFEHLARVGDDAQDDLNIVASQARQIEGILSDQEKFSNARPVVETLEIEELLGEAANVIPKEDAEHVDLTLDQSLRDVRVAAHRIGLLQVMGNLILNAYESIKRHGENEGHIALAASSELVDDKNMVRLSVRDNGTGFDSETGRQIFQRGFTSKTKDETTGLGLHWCANAVAGMGGRIIADSGGEGRGAEFHVLLPAAQGG